MSKIWSDEKNVAKLVELYEADLETMKTNASQTENLTKIGKAIGEGISAAQVRGKLNSLGIYQPVEKAASKPKTNQLRKEHYVRAIAHTLGIDADELDSLKGGTISALKLLAENLGITDIATASAKGYELEPTEMVSRFMTAHAVDSDDLLAFEATEPAVDEE